MTELYPFKFAPIFKEAVWGGQRLATILGKALPAGNVIGESWELVDLPRDQSRVEGGSLDGIELHQLLDRFGSELMGPAGLDGGRFPLLVKYIDASRTLSIQVHPDAEVAARLGGRPKSEAWYIMGVDPNAKLYLGLTPGTDAETLEAAIERGTVEHHVVDVTPSPGELYPVSPGTVHAIGAGVLLAEVQQPSDTTYRVHDWNRVGLDGRPRQLHVAEALQSIHYDARVAPAHGGEVELQLFTIDNRPLRPGEELRLDGEGPLVAVGLEGECTLVLDGAPGVGCARGETVLLPHACRRATLRAGDGGPARALLVTFPAQERA